MARPLFLLVLASLLAVAVDAGEPVRPTWTQSRVLGGPDPPRPFRFERVFPGVKLTNPTELVLMPDGKRWMALEQSGVVKTFPNDPATSDVFEAFDVRKDLKTLDRFGFPVNAGEGYGLVFHPKFAENRWVYLTYVVVARDGHRVPNGTRVSRFDVTHDDPPKLDPASEVVVFDWLQGGHNGGCLRFGPDGMLYISTGDGSFPNPPDELLAGQDMTNVLCSVLRIDVDRPGPDGKPYTIPADNPFVDSPGARGEIWCYGFRNPWKISFDRGSGDLWVADVGWETYETVHRVERGGNYGWSIMEGSQLVRDELAPGPTPITPPTIEHSHVEAASITGGFVYRGKKHGDLVGAYVYGDWETRKMWAARRQADGSYRADEAIEPTVRLSAMAEDADGELLALDYDEGTLHAIVPNENAGKTSNFPTKLSETGLFADVAKQVPSDGVLPFDVSTPMWHDGATATRWIALPGDQPVKWFAHDVGIPGSMFSTNVVWPKNSVLVKTIERETDPGQPNTRRKLETQLLHYDGRAWNAYAYAWNAEQTDATLVPAEGAATTVAIADPHRPGERSELHWRHVGRAECLRCHNSWARYSLAFNPLQLRGRIGESAVDEWTRMERLGVVAGPLRRQGEPPVDKPAEAEFKRPAPLPASADTSLPLEARARAYLHTNCGHCHMMGGGGAADLDLSWTTTLDKAKLLEARPLQGTLGVPDGRLIAAGRPYQSVLLHRMARQGRGRMPHIGSELVDPKGLRLVHDWIASLKPLDGAPRPRTRVHELLAGDFPSGQFDATAQAPETALEWALLLDTMEPRPERDGILAAAAKLDDPERRGVFERFLPAKDRKLVHTAPVNRRAVLAMAGDVERGRKWFATNQSAQCKNCHKAQGIGGEIGPALDGLGAKRSKAQLLDSLLEPSKIIEPKWTTHVIETEEGQLFNGLIVEESATELKLKNARNETTTIDKRTIERRYTNRRSLMPEGQAQGLKLEEIADVLAWLESLR